MLVWKHQMDSWWKATVSTWRSLNSVRARMRACACVYVFCLCHLKCLDPQPSPTGLFNVQLMHIYTVTSIHRWVTSKCSLCFSYTTRSKWTFHLFMQRVFQQPNTSFSCCNYTLNLRAKGLSLNSSAHPAVFFLCFSQNIIQNVMLIFWRLDSLINLLILTTNCFSTNPPQCHTEWQCVNIPVLFLFK